MSSLPGARSSTHRRAAPTRERRDPRLVAATSAVLLLALVAGASAGAHPLAPIGVLAVSALVVAVWLRPVVAAVIVAAVVPALAGLGRGTGVPGLKLSELLLALCTVTVLLRVPARWRRFNGADLALLAFALAAAALAVRHAADGSSTFDTLLRVGLQPTFLFLAWWTASRSVAGPGDVVTVVRWALLVSAVPAAMAVLQFLDVPGARALLIALTGGDLLSASGETFNRVTGPFPIWHSLGGYLIIPTVVAVLLLLRDDRVVLRRPALITVLALNAAALVASVTVTLLLWTPVAIVVAAFLARRTRRALAVLACIAAGALLLFPSILLDRFEAQASAASGAGGGLVPQTVAYRFLVWQRDYFPLLEQGAAFGVGNELPSTVFFTSTENQFITWALRGGLVLVAAACLAMGALLVRSYRQTRAADRPTATAAMALVGVLCFLPAALMVWPYMTNAGLPLALFGFAGALLAESSDHRPRALATVPRVAPPTVPTGR
ncbi:hypothetical protein [Kineococcus sp. SYSU DK018]|uniref:hypothetical protein n=1 Tax=Kineococcus sp. SYSU DK018 TaxID=3383139 RepID=UPI003D7C3A9C